MGVGEDFAKFCGDLTIRHRDVIGQRYRLITRRLNLEYWNTESDTAHSFYTGSYGRGTAIDLTSDVDMIFRLPDTVYQQYAGYSGNGPSALLQAVRSAIRITYPATEIGADGHVVVVPFGDGITFEVVPAFNGEAGSFVFPNSSGGGSWGRTNPKAEVEAIDARDKACNGNLKQLGRMARAWKAKWDVPIGGLLIDTLAYAFIENWAYRDKSHLYYDWMSRDFFDFLAQQNATQDYWRSPGAGQYVWRTGNFEYKATRCRNLALAAIAYEGKGQVWAARQSWREIYGTSYPS